MKWPNRAAWCNPTSSDSAAETAARLFRDVILVSAYTDAVQFLSRRSLTVAECRARLVEREHPDVDIEQAITHLLETGGLDDGRFARAYARTAVDVKGRGRLRVQRELQARGVDHETASAAVGEVFGEKDERSLVAKALQKKLRGKPRPANAGEFARLYQHLLRQGFTPTVVSAELRKLRPRQNDEGTIDPHDVSRDS
jgi:regulatory protein